MPRSTATRARITVSRTRFPAPVEALAEEIGAAAGVDVAEPPDCYGVNCAHPLHVAPALADDDGEPGDASWRSRIAALWGTTIDC